MTCDSLLSTSLLQQTCCKLIIKTSYPVMYIVPHLYHGMRALRHCYVDIPATYRYLYRCQLPEFYLQQLEANRKKRCEKLLGYIGPCLLRYCIPNITSTLCSTIKLLLSTLKDFVKPLVEIFAVKSISSEKTSGANSERA